VRRWGLDRHLPPARRRPRGRLAPSAPATAPLIARLGGWVSIRPTARARSAHSPPARPRP
jgi:hypothetical protein